MIEDCLSIIASFIYDVDFKIILIVTNDIIGL